MCEKEDAGDTQRIQASRAENRGRENSQCPRRRQAPKEDAERGWERRQRGQALDREAGRAKVWYWPQERILGHPQMPAKLRQRRTVRFKRSG